MQTNILICRSVPMSKKSEQAMKKRVSERKKASIILTNSTCPQSPTWYQNEVLKTMLTGYTYMYLSLLSSPVFSTQLSSISFPYYLGFRNRPRKY